MHWLHFSHFHSACWKCLSLNLFLLVSPSHFTRCPWTLSASWQDGGVMSCELHAQVLTLKVTSPELGIEWLSLDTDLTVWQLREVTDGWKPSRIATEGRSEISYNCYISGETFAQGGVGLQRLENSKRIRPWGDSWHGASGNICCNKTRQNENRPCSQAALHLLFLNNKEMQRHILVTERI